MVDQGSISRAGLTIVAGRPGSGKTTLAQALARAIRCPAICRDEIKEGLVNSLAPGTALTDTLQRQTNDAFFATLELLSKHGVTLVAEAAFQHRIWALRLELLLKLARTRIIVCTCDPALARIRHIQRGLADPLREKFHGDAVVQAAREGTKLAIDDFNPPKLDVPTLSVDTTDEYQPDWDRVIAFARGDS